MKIAFLFLTIDNVKFPKIWDYYFKNNLNKINIYCHPKNPENVTVPWQKKNIINNLEPTEWGKIIYAIISLFKSALQYKDNKKFIILSEWCLPIKSFNSLYRFLENDHINTSYIDYWKKPKKDHNILKSKLPKNYFNYELKKHSTWFCLSRHHVKKLLANPEIHKFKKVIVGDENILTLIYGGKHIKNFKITYANWKANVSKNEEIRIKIKNYFIKKEKEKTNKYDGIIKKLRKERFSLGAHPKTYEVLSKKELNEIKESESFFYRKFSSKSDITKYYKTLLTDN